MPTQPALTRLEAVKTELLGFRADQQIAIDIAQARIAQIDQDLLAVQAQIDDENAP
jgi:hypothetical protein